MTSHLLIALAASLGLNITMFLIAFRYKTDKLTDISYALSFIVLMIYGLTTGNMTTASLVIFAMIVVWAGRLGSFLLMRIWNKGKDKRFDAMRNNFLAFGRFWILQAITVWIVSLPALYAFTHVGDIGLLVVVGALIWLKGLSIETVADLQKYEFSNEPGNKGKWIDKGLWRYSRHPNYFGEMLVWVGVYLAALPALSGNERFIAVISPIFIIVLLLFVSGIPLLEKVADERWGKNKAYQAYKKRTSMLIIIPK